MVGDAKRLFCYLIIISPLFLWAAGCAIPKQYIQPDPANPVKTVAVLPMVNHTNDVEAPEMVRDMFAKRVPEWHYVIKPINEVNQILKDELGITLGSQLDLTNPQELGKKLGVDGVIYGDLYDFNEKTAGILNIRRVRAGFKLVDTKTGAFLWGRGQGVKSETKMTGGGAGLVADMASGIGTIQDKNEKEDEGSYIGITDWYELPEEEAYGQQYGALGSLAAGLAEKAIKKATGTFLEKESKMMIDLIIENLPPGPGVAVAALPATVLPAIELPPMPEFSIPGYFEFGDRDFTAVMVMTSVIKSSNEKIVFESKLARLGNNFRSEVDMSKAFKGKGGDIPSGFGKNIFIERPDLKLDYIVYPDKKKYLEIAITEEATYDDERVEKKKVGSETIDGHPCDKYQIKVTYKDGAVEEGYFWEAMDMQRFVIRAEMEDKDAKTVIELKDIKLVSPPKALFEVPQGYVKASNIMEIFMEGDE